MGGGVGVAEAGVDGDKGVGTDFFAELDELVGTEVVVFDSAPSRVSARWAAVTVADSVAPVVTAHEVSAGPAVDGAAEIFELFEGVSAHAFDVVSRHDREGTEGDGAAIDSDGNGHFVAGFVSLEPVGKLRVASRLGADGCGFGAERDGNFGGASEGLKPDVANVFFSCEGAEAVLADLGSVGEDGSVATDKDVLFRHFDFASVDFPGRCADAGEVGVFHRDIGRVGGFDGVEELTIFEHLGPDSTVDAAAQVFNELTIDIRIDHVPGFGWVYGDAN